VALLDQWIVSLQEELGVKQTDIAAFGGGHRPTQPALINVIVVNSARRLTSKFTSHGLWLVIADECHRLGSQRNLEALNGKFAASLGLSATPERQYDDALDDHLIPRLGDVVYSYDLAAARKEGVISPFTLINVKVEMLPDEAEEYNRLSKRIGMLSACRSVVEPSESASHGKLEALLRARSRVSNRATMRIPVTCKLVNNHKNNRMMVFHEDIRSADKIVALLKDKGHSVTSYHTKIGPSLRTSNLLLYRRGVFEVMVSCRALDEGINIPETQVAIIASSTATQRQRIQRLGRVLRPAASKKRAIIYTLYATDVEQDRLEKEYKRLGEIAEIKWMKVHVRL
jgi:superfamily II DNA or RNA helicase